MDLKNLPPAPWRVDEHSDEGATAISGPREQDCGLYILQHDDESPWDSPTSKALAEFAPLARNAFDVMMRRGWSALKSPVADEGWRVDMNDGEYFSTTSMLASHREPCHWPDPFTALVEADKWWAENVEHVAK